MQMRCEKQWNTEMTIGALVEGVRREDQTAAAELYGRTYEAVSLVARSMVRDQDAADDVVQDAFLKAFQSLSALDDPEKFLPWVKQIARNKALDYLKRSRPVLFSEMTDEESDEEPDFLDERFEYLPEAVLERKETVRMVRRILSEINQDQYLAVTMYHFQNRSIREIAQDLGCSENTVKSRLKYGREKIAARVRELENQDANRFIMAYVFFLLESLGILPARPSEEAA